METSIQISIIENSLEVLKTGPEILVANQTRKDKAIQVGINIISTIEEKGMTPETDERAMKYLANIATANKEMKESRAAVTQIMDQLKKMYTEVENELDPKKGGTVPNRIQAHRDQYAKQVAEEQERKRKEAERMAAKKKEAIDIASYVERWISEKLISLLSARKTALVASFNTITLDNFEDKSTKLSNLKPYILNTDLLASIGEMTNMPASVYHSRDEAHAIKDQVFIDYDFNQWAINTWQVQITEMKEDLLQKLPSKKAELLEEKRLADEAAAARERARIAEEQRKVEMEKANAKERQRLEAEAELARRAEAERQAELKKQQDQAAADRKRREEEEAQRLAIEAKEAQRVAEQNADIKKQGEQTMALFEQEAALAEIDNAVEARQGYEINILHPVGYTQIFAFWFEQEGKNQPIDKLGNTKLDQMKAWAEKHAHKTGTKIESKFLEYVETFKAINRKAK